MYSWISKISFFKKVLIIVGISIFLFSFFKFKIFPYQQIALKKNIYIDSFFRNEFYKKEALKCNNQNHYLENNNSKKYSFFIAGHTYGSPQKKNIGLYKDFYRTILNNDKYDFGILAGDFVQEPSNEAWSAVDKQIENLDYKIYLVAGNHDFDKKNGLYEKRYGKSYYHFKYESDLFIILNSAQDNLNIIDHQLHFLKKTIQKKKFDNLYIISHHMIWMFNEEIFNSNKDEKLNFTSNYLPKTFKTNFWTDIAPILLELKKNVYLISGNIGQFPWQRSLFCKNYKNIKFLSTGMGGGRYDNFITFENNKNGKLKIDFKFF